MSAPHATYRLQLREGMTFARVAELAPYLQGLGISHVYLSPIFRAVPGSTHGYDAASFSEIEPDLGGEDGFAAMTDRLKAHGLKVIVDFVPNHMGASPTNPWWRDALEWGAASHYAQHFDVDWSAPKLIIPTLGKSYGEALSAGELGLRFDAKNGAFLARYEGLELPLTPPSYASLLTRAEPDGFAELARRFAASSPETGDQLRHDLADAARDATTLQKIEDSLAALEADRAALHAVLEAQVWRLAHWRASRESLTYRRFFEISDLVGVRVEQPRVFDDVHAKSLSLVSDGLVDGLRIDHIDGLADPLDYLKRLREAVGADTYIIVEKILGDGEALRSEWPVAGTTGYEFIRDLASILVAECEPDLTRGYARFIGHDTDYAAETVAIKRRTIARNLAGELDVLGGQALELAQGDIDTRDFGADTLRRALIELAANLSVYRTYVDNAGARAEDLDVLKAAASAAKASREVEDEGAIDLLVRYLTLDVEAPERQVAALAFATRFQQTTGPLMAKAVEDTLFYRFNRLIAVNEVGGEPACLGGDIGEFHERMAVRQATMPRALTTTATHDTKRGEDARARIYAISEMSEVWAEAVGRWSEMLAPYRTDADGAPIPEPELEWLFYQTLLGACPANPDISDPAGLAKLQERMVAFMQKAAREAKLRTSWAQPNESYEASLTSFVREALTPERSHEFLTDFASVARPLILAGAINSLTQLAIKLFAPGVPDIYQGTELWDLALVDPDNRRLVDYDTRTKLLDAPETSAAQQLAHWQNGSVKLLCLKRCLALRARGGDALLTADYVALRIEGPLALHVIAFARTWSEQVVIVIGTRFALSLLDGATIPHIAAKSWGDTVVVLPPQICGLDAVNVLTGQTVSLLEERIQVAVLLAELPIAVLARYQT